MEVEIKVFRRQSEDVLTHTTQAIKLGAIFYQYYDHDHETNDRPGQERRHQPMSLPQKCQRVNLTGKQVLSTYNFGISIIDIISTIK